MAETIKGINVVIGADTTALSAALSDVNKRGKDLQGELKQIDKLLKLDPGNTELLAQKQQVLTEAISSTSDKLQTLRAAQQQVAEQFARGDITQGQYRAFQREVTQTEQELKRLQNSLSSLNVPKITVVIDGDTKDLDEALGSVNKKSKDLQSELRQVDQLLKFDPGNTELIAQKQKLLADAVSNTSDKLNTLRSTQQQVADQFARGEISEEQYRAFQRELVRTEQDLQRLDRSLRESRGELDDLADAADEAGDRLAKAGDKLTKAGAGLTAGVTLPLAAAGTAAVKSALDVESATSRMQAALGLPEAEARKLADAARGIWTEGFGESLDDVNQALITTRTNIRGLNDEDLEDLTRKAMILGETWDTDVTEVTRTASVMMKNFGITGQDAMDIITAGFQNGGNFSDELLDTLREYAPQFKALGISADDALGILIQGAESGAFNLDKVGDALKEFNIRLKDGSDTTYEAMAMLFAPDNIEEFTMALMKGSTTSAEYMELLKHVSADTAKSLVEGLKEGGKASEDSYNALLGIMGDSNKIWQGLSDGSLKGQDALVQVLQKLREVEDPLLQNTLAVSLFGTQWEDLEKDVVLSLDQGIGKLGEFAGATDAAGAALKDNMAAQATAMFRQLMVSLLPLGEIMLNVAEQILPVLQSALQWLTETLSNMSPGMQTVIVVVGALAAALGPILVIVGQILPVLSSLAPVFAALTGPIGLVVAAIAGLVAGFAILYEKNEGFRNAVNEVWAQIKDVFVRTWEEIVAFVKPLLEDFSAFFKETFAGLQSFWEEHGEAIKLFVDVFLKTIGGYFKVQFEAIKTVVTVAWTIMKAIITTTIETIKLVISNALDIIQGIFKVFSKLLQGDWQGAWEAIKETAANIMENIITFFKNIDLVQVGKDIIQGLINGIASMASVVGDTVRDIADTVKRGISNALDIRSPSRVMKQLGEYTGEGFALGLDNTIASVKDGASNMANAAQSALQGLTVPSTANLTASVNSAASAPVSLADMFRGAIFNVRNDNDIKLIGQELGSVINQNTRALGGA